MKSNKILIIYSFFICLFLTIVGIFSAKDVTQLLSSFIFLPLIFYFGTKMLHFIRPTAKKVTVKKKISSPLAIVSDTQEVIIPEEIPDGVTDGNKRLFLKLIGSTGFSLLLMALFTKKAQAAFFGSVPGPGVVAIKDIAGNKINPAEKNPTDGYEITEIDDTGSPAYYGFVKNTGAWYIMQEDSTGAYRYAKGDTGFSIAWGTKELQSYGYFNTTFG
jgi:hypothetical protein